MESDRELLELAAKAAGIVGSWERDNNVIQERWHFNVPYDNQGMLTGFEWNPLTDDGDALRLAVKLGIDLEHQCPGVEAYRSFNHPHYDGTGAPVFGEGEDGGDQYAATRRAIVRAAAHIGIEMQ